MTIDAWNPKSFGAEISEVLTTHSKLIFEYHTEDRRLMDEHLNSSPYQSLQPNHLFPEYQYFHENTLAPIVAKSRIRAWHYTRLTDEEADAIRQELVPSSLEYLRYRLNNLVAKNVLKENEAETIFAQSPFHKQSNRAGYLCTTIIPLSHFDSGVEPLLKSWGGESAYFWITDKGVAKNLKSLGTPRIIEIETALTDKLNGYKVAETFLFAWARQLGAQVTLSGCDLFIRECIDTAKVLHIHTEGDSSFEAIGTDYPVSVGKLLEDENE
ncbi:MAG: hypothetical protein KZQ92_22060 [Candidatus Thiodiazotropha sp. (ex Lucinoma borealis)]|nr:hypothetical protein [Candidatus Thiodiazotropha sp. (ex Lucinoma borealis)]